MALSSRRLKTAYILMTLFALMIVVGLLWGGFGRVMTNAIVICLDCIGII